MFLAFLSAVVRHCLLASSLWFFGSPLFRFPSAPLSFCSLLFPCSLCLPSLPLFLSSLSLLLPSDLFLPLPLSFCSPHLRFLSPLHFSPSSLLPRPFSLVPSPCSLPALSLPPPTRSRTVGLRKSISQPLFWQQVFSRSLLPPLPPSWPGISVPQSLSRPLLRP